MNLNVKEKVDDGKRGKNKIKKMSWLSRRKNNRKTRKKKKERYCEVRD